MCCRCGRWTLRKTRGRAAAFEPASAGRAVCECARRFPSLSSCLCHRPFGSLVPPNSYASQTRAASRGRRDATRTATHKQTRQQSTRRRRGGQRETERDLIPRHAAQRSERGLGRAERRERRDPIRAEREWRDSGRRAGADTDSGKLTRLMSRALACLSDHCAIAADTGGLLLSARAFSRPRRLVASPRAAHRTNEHPY